MRKTRAIRLEFEDPKKFTTCISALVQHGVGVETGAMLTMGKRIAAEFLVADYEKDNAIPIRDRVAAAMKAAGMEYELATVLTAFLPDDPQAFAVATTRLMDAGILTSMYALDFEDSTVRVAFGTPDPDQATKLLEGIALDEK